MEHQQVYTTPEAARETGIPEGTIRCWLSRHGECFEVGKHIVEQHGKRLWTQEGLQLLKTRATENAVLSAANTDAGAVDFALDSTASINADGKALHVAMLDSFIEQTAKELAATFWQQLPARTLQHIQRMMNAPLPQEREVVQQSMQQVMQLLPRPQSGKHIALPEAEEIAEECLSS